MIPDAFARALDEEKVRNARQLGLFRWIGVTLFLSLQLGLDWYAREPGARRFPLLLIGYWVASAGLFWSGRHWPKAARLGSLAIPFLDLPMVFLIQSGGLATSTDPRALANFTLGLNICLLMLAAVSLETWQVCLAAAIGAGLQFRLQQAAHDLPIGLVGALLLIAIAAAICYFALRRRIEMVSRICDHQIRRERLGRYFSPQVAAHIEEEANEIAAGQQCDVTVLFSDLRDFTLLSERLTGVEIVALLNDYHARMVQSVFAHGGTLDKYLGDGIMAYFGAPVAQPDHAERALRCALAMQDQLTELNTQRHTQGQPPIRMGIGIHTGPAVVGSIGAPHRREFTAIGDTVNLASRLEQLSKFFDLGIIVSAATRHRIGETLAFRPLELAQVKGKASPIQTYTPIP